MGDMVLIYINTVAVGIIGAAVVIVMQRDFKNHHIMVRLMLVFIGFSAVASMIEGLGLHHAPLVTGAALHVGIAAWAMGRVLWPGRVPQMLR